MDFQDSALILNLNHLLLIIDLDLLFLLLLQLHRLLNMFNLHLSRIATSKLMIKPMHQLLKQSLLDMCDFGKEVGVFVLYIGFCLFVPAVMAIVTFNTSLVTFSSWQNSNDSWWNYQSFHSNILLFRPTCCPVSYAPRKAPTLHDHSNPLSWYLDLNDYATSPCIACQYVLTNMIHTWQVLRDGGPLLRTILLHKFDKIGILLVSPRSLFPLIILDIHLEAASPPL